MKPTSGRYRILVTGWRGWPEHLAEFIEIVLGATIAAVIVDTCPVTVVHGACPYGGVDAIADRIVQTSSYFRQPLSVAGTRRLDVEAHPAEITASGRILGPARNSRMVELGADRCLAFPGPGSRGTVDCYQKAIRAGIRTEVYPLAYAEAWSAAGEPLEIL